MYELKCPECGHVLTAPFVRVGAVASCAKCNAQYLVREQNITRKSSLTATDGQTTSGTSSVLIGEDDPHEQSSPHDTDVTGLSGLSGLMSKPSHASAVPSEAASTPSESSPPKAAAAAPPSDIHQSVAASRQRAARQRHRRQTRAIVMLVMVGLGIVILAAAGVFVMTQHGVGYTPHANPTPQAVTPAPAATPSVPAQPSPLDPPNPQADPSDEERR